MYLRKLRKREARSLEMDPKTRRISITPYHYKDENGNIPLYNMWRVGYTGVAKSLANNCSVLHYVDKEHGEIVSDAIFLNKGGFIVGSDRTKLYGPINLGSCIDSETKTIPSTHGVFVHGRYADGTCVVVNLEDMSTFDLGFDFECDFVVHNYAVIKRPVEKDVITYNIYDIDNDKFLFSWSTFENRIFDDNADYNKHGYRYKVDKYYDEYNGLFGYHFFKRGHRGMDGYANEINGARLVYISNPTNRDLSIIVTENGSLIVADLEHEDYDYIYRYSRAYH